jgi:hypothetical protein
VDIYFPSNLGWFEDGHGLHDERTVDACLIAQLLHSLRVCYFSEEFVVLVQGVPYLVDGLPLGDGEFAVLPGFGLKEVADFAGRV